MVCQTRQWKDIATEHCSPDQEKQKSIDLFLGQGTAQSRHGDTKKGARRSYNRWFKPENIERPLQLHEAHARMSLHAGREPSIWDG